jgi:dihydrolipoamide dehydrogenase
MAEAKTFDLVIIGAGPAGYAAAIRGVELGMKTACVDRREQPGGACLNVGCIPSKALLDSSERLALAQNRMADHGIRISGVELDLARMMNRKNRVVETLTGQLKKLLTGQGITLISGTARLSGNHRVEVESSDGNRTIEGGFILLAPGSIPAGIPGFALTDGRIVDSTGALEFTEAPEHLAIIGGGYIGLELGVVWKRLGSRVTVIEMLPQIAGTLDGQISRTLKRSLERQGIEIRLKTRVMEHRLSSNGVTLTLKSGEKQETLDCDRVLVAAGRKPLTEDLGLEAAGIEIDSATGCIRTDAGYQTTATGIYAAGDVIPGPMLAHKASAEGIAAVESMNGLHPEVNYDALPSVVYTSPEVGSVGLTEEQAKDRQIPYQSAVFPFSGNGRAQCLGETEGMVKLIAHARTDRILGVHLIGPHVSEILAECVTAMEFGAGAEDMARIIHSHPTFSEAVMDAARAVSIKQKKNRSPHSR